MEENEVRLQLEATNGITAAITAMLADDHALAVSTLAETSRADPLRPLVASVGLLQLLIKKYADVCGMTPAEVVQEIGVMNAQVETWIEEGRPDMPE